MTGEPRVNGLWRHVDGLVHVYVARKTARGWYTLGTLCLTYEDMYLEHLPVDDGVVTCLSCLADPHNIL